MLHVCAIRFDVTENLEKIIEFLEVNKAIVRGIDALRSSSSVSSCWISCNR